MPFDLCFGFHSSSHSSSVTLVSAPGGHWSWPGSSTQALLRPPLPSLLLSAPVSANTPPLEFQLGSPWRILFDSLCLPWSPTLDALRPEVSTLSCDDSNVFGRLWSAYTRALDAPGCWEPPVVELSWTIRGGGSFTSLVLLLEGARKPKLRLDTQDPRLNKLDGFLLPRFFLLRSFAPCNSSTSETARKRLQGK